MKLFLLVAAGLVTGATVLTSTTSNKSVDKAQQLNKTKIQSLPASPSVAQTFSGTSVSDVVTKALAFKALLTTTQQATLEKTYTTTLGRKWSNLPCGSGCRNGIQFSTLTTTQLAAAKEVAQAALGTASNQGYDLFSQILLADDYLNANGGGSGYGAGIYFISYLNTPSTSSAWMLQIGGHHMAFNIAFNGGVVVGTTPVMLGVEPKLFTVSGTTYTPLANKQAAMANMLASLTSTQLTTAKLSSTFSDCLMSPGESNGNSNTMPATKQGLICSGLTTAQKNLVIAAIQTWTDDMDASAAATLLATYSNDINNIYIGWTGSGTSGSASTFLNANTNYVRIDGTRVWIEFVCQSGVVFSAQIHYHSVWRDHTNDYGSDLTNTTLPLKLLDFNAANAEGKRVVRWITAEETNVDHYTVQRSIDGRTYSDIKQVAAQNKVSNAYTISDNDLITENVIYYRIKMVGKDGSFSYSKIASVRNGYNTSLSVFPNPAGNTLQVGLKNTVSNAKMQIIAADGKVVLMKSGLNGQQLNIDIAALPKGSFTVMITENEIVFKSRFIKQ